MDALWPPAPHIADVLGGRIGNNINGVRGRVAGVDCPVVVTDLQLLVRLPDATLGSLWWGAVVGFEADAA